ncbi:hypothetical protein F909_02360 [Acinetobacter sp. ANC 3929]|nr:hypothetical protein F909_02360 [Acinetobacter sp. ANC 3929]
MNLFFDTHKTKSINIFVSNYNPPQNQNQAIDLIRFN